MLDWGAMLKEVSTAPLGDAEPKEQVTTNELQPGMRAGEHIILCKLGTGGFGTVYLAEHRLLNRKAAIKVLHRDRAASPEIVARFIREARAANRIAHDNIIDVYEFGELEDGRPYYVMEWLDGENLRDRIERGALPIADAVEILCQVGRGLRAVHDRGIVHRDIKPENVFLVNRRGSMHVKLLDFGIAKLTSDEDIDWTATGARVGTPRYMSPEQARRRDVTPKSDVYSAGVIAFEMLTGRPAFTADNDADLLVRVLHQRVPPASQFRRELPAALDRLIAKMLEKDPAERPDLATVMAALERPSTLRDRKWRRWVLVAGATVAASTAIVANIVMQAEHAPSAPAISIPAHVGDLPATVEHASVAESPPPASLPPPPDPPPTSAAPPPPARAVSPARRRVRTKSQPSTPVAPTTEPPKSSTVDDEAPYNPLHDGSAHRQ